MTQGQLFVEVTGCSDNIAQECIIEYQEEQDFEQDQSKETGRPRKVLKADYETLLCAFVKNLYDQGIPATSRVTMETRPTLGRAYIGSPPAQVEPGRTK